VSGVFSLQKLPVPSLKSKLVISQVNTQIDELRIKAEKEKSGGFRIVVCGLEKTDCGPITAVGCYMK
jgi:hypothetical protein